MTTLERLEEYFDRPGRLSRRALLGKTAKMSAAMVATVSGAGAFADVAYASHTGCCGLCSLCCGWSECPGGCPGGCTPYEWTCSNGACSWLCGECCTAMCSGAGCAAECKCSYARVLCNYSSCPCPDGVEPMSVTSVKDLYRLPQRQRGTCH